MAAQQNEFESAFNKAVGQSPDLTREEKQWVCWIINFDQLDVKMVESDDGYRRLLAGICVTFEHIIKRQNQHILFLKWFMNRLVKFNKTANADSSRRSSELMKWCTEKIKAYSHWCTKEILASLPCEPVEDEEVDELMDGFDLEKANACLHGVPKGPQALKHMKIAK